MPTCILRGIPGEEVVTAANGGRPSPQYITHKTQVVSTHHPLLQSCVHKHNPHRNKTKQKRTGHRNSVRGGREVGVRGYEREKSIVGVAVAEKIHEAGSYSGMGSSRSCLHLVRELREAKERGDWGTVGPGAGRTVGVPCVSRAEGATTRGKRSMGFHTGE